MCPKFFIATAQVKDGPRHVFVVHPNGDLTEDQRTPDQILSDASHKGFEVSHCALYTANIGRYTSEQLKARVVHVMRRKYADIRSEWDLEIDVVGRILDPGPEARKRQAYE
jgi:hypothetical protein